MDKKYVTSIKRKYRERLISREQQWPPCQSNKLVRLELVEGVKGEGCYARHTRGEEDNHVKRTPLKYEDLFKVESGKKPVRKILVEGDAGIGKTTLSIAVSEDWANEKLFQQFKLLLLLPLRHKKVASVGSLPELLKVLHTSQTLCSSVADYLYEIEGDEVLIIADGWDEINQLKGSFLYELLFKGHLPFTSVIVTSRHSATAEFHQASDFDRFVEITGFNKESIAEYIQSEFSSEPDKADSLRQQLEANPLIDSVCSVPLNCAIICYLWQHKHKEALPTTMTELYSTIIRNVIFRNIEKDANNSRSILRLSNFADIPEGLKQPWHFLCRFAFKTMTKDQVVFSEDELDKQLESHKNIFCFGLLQQSLFLLDDGYGKSYHFLHRTFQEFLAAFHLAKLVSESRVSVEEIFQSHALIENFDIFWRFFFGIYFNVIKCDNYHAIKPYLSYVCALYTEDHIRGRFTLRLCHSAYEAKNQILYDNVIQALIKNAFKGSVLFSGSHTAHDCAAMIDVISHMQDCKIRIFFKNCGLRHDQVTLLGKELQKHKKLQVHELELNGNKLESVDSLFISIFLSLQHLNLSYNMIKIVNFLKLPYNQLTHVNLSDNPLGISGMNSLQTTIAGGSLSSLKSLLMKNSLTRDIGDTIDPTEFSNILTTLSTHCPHLAKLDLSQNNLGVAGALELVKIKSQHNELNQDWLSEVILNEINFGDKGLCTMAKIDGKCCFRELYLGGNDIHVTGLKYLVKAIGWKIKMKEAKLALENNPLGLWGAIELGKLLMYNSDKLTCLNLSRCQLTDDPLTCNSYRDVCKDWELIQPDLYKFNSNGLVQLHLDGNRFTGDGIHILTGLVHLCPRLRILSTRDCAISSSDFIQILDKFVQSKLAHLNSIRYTAVNSLRAWNLYNNRIDHEGVSTLIKYIPSSIFFYMRAAYKVNATYLVDLNLGDNPISDEMINKLNREWCGRQEVRCTLL